MPNEYRPAPDVAEIARLLIVRVAQHQELVNARIEYVFIKDAPKSRGRETWGRARKVTGLQAWLSNPETLPHPAGFVVPSEFFVIEISHSVWLTLDDGQKVALVDHELSHCAITYDEETGAPKLAMRHHDVEEFVGVITRNGLWKQDVQYLGICAAEQLRLDVDRVEAAAQTGGA